MQSHCTNILVAVIFEHGQLIAFHVTHNHTYLLLVGRVDRSKEKKNLSETAGSWKKNNK